MTSVLERNIQIELYRVLQNLVAKKFSFNQIEFVGVRFEPTINGRPDGTKDLWGNPVFKLSIFSLR